MNIIKNRGVICNVLSFEYDKLKTLNQVHSASVVSANDKNDKK